MKKIDFYCAVDKEKLIRNKINEIVDWINNEAQWKAKDKE
ncbi:hypothetical protein LCGC14_0569600 [marine sediment metagenome]|uniref:Uncharacterized protein n=1 Tax=marine sediment metagenome TaxID=412755 RepID=A0A0F9USN2_9ZZZZ